MEDDDEIPPHQKPRPSGRREDSWSDAATAVLIEAWAEKYLALDRGHLRQHHWEEVAEIVAASEGHRTKTKLQCKYRVDTVKRLYKLEIARVAAGNPPSNWPHFNRLDELIGPTAGDAPKIPPTIPAGVNPSHRKRSENPPVPDSEPESSSDGLPPPVLKKRPKKSGNSLRELTRSILKFAEAYERTETAKVMQLVEMEKERMKFQKDLEVLKMKNFAEMQLELFKLKNKKIQTSNDDNNVKGNDPINKNDSDSKN